MRKQPLSVFRGRLEISKYIFNKDYRRIHDDPEVHGSDGKQVRAFALKHQQEDGEKERKGDVESNDQRAAKVAEKNPLDQEDQQASENQVVQNGVRGDRDERGTVIKRNYLHTRWETPVVIQLVNCCFHLRDHVGGFFGAPHHHDGPDNIILPVSAQNPQPWPVTDRHLANILHQHRDTVDLIQHHVLDVAYLVALRQIIVTAIINQSDSTDIDGLLSNPDFAPAHIDVCIAQGRQDLWHRHAVGFELVSIHLDLKFLRGATPTIHRRDARNRQEAACDNPVLDCTQVSNSEVRWAHDLIAIDFSS